MKITKRQLRRIIREEKARLVRENSLGLGPAQGPKDAYDTMAHARTDGDMGKFISNIERVVEFGGQDFSDDEIKGALAEVLKRLGIQATIT